MLPPLPPLSSTPQLGWEANGSVQAVAAKEGVAFIGGSFTHVGPPATANSAVVSVAAGVPRYGLPRVDGEVLAATSDGAGGWFIGGRFQTAGGVSCPRLAHVRPNLTVDPAFCPRPDRPPLAELPTGLNNGLPEVRTLLRNGDVLYVGGVFRQIRSQPRTHLAALSIATGELLPWNPAIVRDDGTFPTTQGPASDGIGAVVNTLARTGTTLYVGGAFSAVNGVPRKSVAAVSTADASVLPFEARVTINVSGNSSQIVEGRSQPVLALAIGGTRAFIGGDFNLVNGVARSGLAAVDRTTGAVETAWNAQALPGAGIVNPRVLALRASGSSLYVGGEFGRVQRSGFPTGGSDLTASGPNIAAVSTTASTVRAWVPGTDGVVRAFSQNGSNIVFAGSFQTAGGASRPGAAEARSATSPASGALLPWNPRVGFTAAAGFTFGVSALATAGSETFLGGSFGHVGGVDRAGLAAIDTATGEATAWDARLEGGSRRVDALVVRDQTLYVAGDFARAAGQDRAGLAGLSTASAAATAWRPADLGVPAGLLSGPAGIHVLGRDLDVQAAVPAVATDPLTGATAPWSPAVAGTAFIVPAERGIRVGAVSGDTLVLGGSFGTIGGQVRPQLGSVSATSGAVTGWSPGGVGFGIVRALAVRPVSDALTAAFIGGTFTQAGGQPRKKLAAVDVATGVLTDWAPGLDSPLLGERRGDPVHRLGHRGGRKLLRGRRGQPSRPRAALAHRAGDAARVRRPARRVGARPGLRAARREAGGSGASSRAPGGRNQAGIAIFPREPDVGDAAASVRRTGVWRAPVRCPAGTAGGCRLRATLRELATPRRRVIGRAVARVAAGRVVRLRFPVTRAGLALLGVRRRVPVRVAVVSRDRLGNRTATQRRFTLTLGR